MRSTSGSSWMRASAAGVVIAAASVLAGCVTVTIQQPPASSSSAPSASPAPSATEEIPGFETIDGVWCPADGAGGCMTIRLPNVVDGAGTPTDTIAAATVTADSAPCYQSHLSDIESGMGEVALFYCPRGVTVEAGLVADLDDPAFDRLYLTQNPPYVDVYFREADLDAALSR